MRIWLQNFVSIQPRTSLESRAAARLVLLYLLLPRGGGVSMAPETATWDPPFRRNFGRLVLGCINTDFCNQILILQHFSRSTRFPVCCTVPNSELSYFFVKSFAIFCCNFAIFKSSISNGFGVRGLPKKLK